MTTIGSHNTFLLSLLFQFLALPLLLLRPETLRLVSDGNGYESISDTSLVESRSFRSLLYRKLGILKYQLSTGVVLLLRRLVLIFSILDLFVNQLSRPIITLFQQYVSTMLGWKLSEVIMSPRIMHKPCNFD